MLDPRQKENLYSFVNEISVEFSLNGHEWPERAMKRLRLNNPYVLRSIEPTSGPISGGTALAIHGDHFVETGQCCVGFLTRGRYAEPTKIRPSVFREELAISEQFSLPDVEVEQAATSPSEDSALASAGRPSASSPERYRALLCPPRSRVRTHSRVSRHPCSDRGPYT